ncbi:hypothetical protein [Mucilaginibacter sp. BT774]|uniref:hypothetical protein n=1 Tax=Mucilaginibacter sp. BT774 TaxID=3062276 RepID=UPI002674751D|nr:hypothetical protein [Mucilaginibacter sp. BT774]MDO3625320.1 hypothetical protein [Mucilaginibacter sp. BT774]
MKHLLILLMTVITVGQATAQKIDYKNNIISVDGKELARVNKIKTNFGLTGNFELYSLSVKKLIIATLATDFVPPNGDNSFYYYRFTFLTANQVGIFPIAKLWSEKSFAKLIGGANIITDDDLNSAKVTEFIAYKSMNPRVAADYTVVQRSLIFPIVLKEDQTIEQERKLIGRFKDLGSVSDVDSYDFSLPNGLTVVKVSFTGGNNAQNFEVYTVKDNDRRIVSLPTKDKVIMASTPANRNEIALGRILRWMVAKGYL